MENIIVRMSESLPLSIHGMVICDENGDYNIYLNSKLSAEEQRKAYEHELEHIHGHDFQKQSLSVGQIEQSCEKRQKEKPPFE